MDNVVEVWGEIRNQGEADIGRTFVVGVWDSGYAFSVQHRFNLYAECEEDAIDRVFDMLCEVGDTEVILQGDKLDEYYKECEEDEIYPYENENWLYLDTSNNAGFIHSPNLYIQEYTL